MIVVEKRVNDDITSEVTNGTNGPSYEVVTKFNNVSYNCEENNRNN